MSLKKQSFANVLCLVVTSVLLVFSNHGFALTAINGLAIHSELGQEQFIGGLLLETPSKSANDILRSKTDKKIEVRILADRLSARRFRQMWIEGMAINAAPATLKTQSENMAAFSNMLKVTLKKGDLVSVERLNDGVNVVINDYEVGRIDDPLFFDLLIQTWIGPVPLSSQFRDNLLAAGELDNTLLSRFNSIAPSQERILAVANALDEKKARAKENAVDENTSELAASERKPAAPSAPVVAKKTVAPITRAPTQLPKIETPSQIAVAKPEISIPKPEKDEALPRKDSKAQVAQRTQVIKPVPAVEDDAILEDDEDDVTAESLLAQQLYISEVKNQLFREIRYPQRSLEREEEGTVRLSMLIGRDGSISNVTPVEVPKYGRLTRASIKAITSALPFPAFPAELTKEELAVTIPFVYKLVDE